MGMIKRKKNVKDKGRKRLDKGNIVDKRVKYVHWVCSIFLRVDRFINEIYNPIAFYSIRLFYKKYVFIYC
jgi:hypothetical protein